ncbi:MAG: hypothetical protein AAGJ18_17045, partial [Bacteroidota bacterium]
MGSIIFKKALPHLVAVLIFAILPSIYFYPVFQGKTLQQSDIIGNAGMVQETNNYSERTGDYTLWTNSMFGGMPTYQIGGYPTSNKVPILFEPFRKLLVHPVDIFFLAMLFFYCLLLAMGLNPWLAIVGGIAFGLGTNNVVLWEAGHPNKLYVIAQSSLILTGVVLSFLKRKYVLGAAVFGFGAGWSIHSNHPQMLYYLLFGLLIFAGIYLFQTFKEKNWAHLGKSVLSLLLVGVLAIGASLSSLWTTYEYSQDTMRGDPILNNVSNTAAKSSSETSGLAWDYAMQWSAGTMDLFNVIIPRVVGGSSAEKVGSDSQFYQDLKRRGAQVGTTIQAPLYWGKVGSTSGTYYYGAIICFFFALGLQIVKGGVKWWLAGAVGLTMLLALGNNFAVLNKLLFNYFPLYSKFRAPSSILGVTSIFFCFLAMLGFHQLIKDSNKQQLFKPLYIAAGVTGGICLFFGLIGPAVFDFAGASDASYRQAGYNLEAIINDRKWVMRSDAFRSLFFIAAATGLCWAYLKDKLNEKLLIIAVGVLVVADLWVVNQRYVQPSDFLEGQSAIEQEFQPRQVDQQILNIEKSRGDYRVFDLSIDPFNSSKTSYFHNTIGGYHPAKLQRYQDVIDYYISKGNQGVLNMLNTKYFINQQGQLQQNPSALGTAWFVESIRKVNTP